MFWPNAGRFCAKYSAAPAQAAKVTFMKSGERPIMPHVARAQCSIIVRRCSRSCRVRGTMNDNPTRCPLLGDGLGTVAQPGVRRHVLDALATQPDLSLLLLQALDVLASRASRHGGPPHS